LMTQPLPRMRPITSHLNLSPAKPWLPCFMKPLHISTNQVPVRTLPWRNLPPAPERGIHSAAVHVCGQLRNEFRAPFMRQPIVVVPTASCALSYRLVSLMAQIATGRLKP
jgi:hypothetical protein